jgi:hypothetical protein
MCLWGHLNLAMEARILKVDNFKKTLDVAPISKGDTLFVPIERL